MLVFIKKVLSKKIASFTSNRNSSDIIKKYIFPMGLFSKPKGEHGVYLDKNKVVIPIQADKKVIVNLSDGDVSLVDGKSYIHLKYSGGDIDIKTINLKIDCTSLVVTGESEFKGNAEFKGSVTNNSIPIDMTHKHTGNLGNPTSPPMP